MYKITNFKQARERLHKQLDEKIDELENNVKTTGSIEISIKYEVK